MRLSSNRRAQAGSQGSVPIFGWHQDLNEFEVTELAISWCGRPPEIITLSPTPNRSLRPPANSRSTQPLRMYTNWMSQV